MERKLWISQGRFLHALSYCMLLPGVLGLPFPAIMLGAGMIGFIGGELWPKRLGGEGTHESDDDGSVLRDEQEAPAHTRPNHRRTLRVLALCLLLWAAPTIAAGFAQGWQITLFHEGLFFSKAAVVTFGGAYAVLPYVAQQAVGHFGWLRPGQMLDGLGLAETTPGPLIMVVQFVGFLGAWQNPDGLAPLLAATLGALLTTWVTFTPCFLWIFLGGPYLERLRGHRRLTSALSAITAAVVGVVLNLAVWFGLQVFFPSRGAIDWIALGLSAIALVGLLRWRWNIIVVVAAGGLAGLLALLLGGVR